MFKLLIVDDEAIIVEGLQLLIPWQKLGVAVTATASSGEEALEIIQKQKIDILLTDISMDAVSGLDLIEALHQLQPDAKTLVLSGFNEFDYIKKGLQLGIENYLLKPVNKNELLQTIHTITEKLRHSSEETTDKHAMKEHITKRIFFNQIEKKEFLERANLLKLKLPAPSCRACILSWSDNTDSTQGDNQPAVYPLLSQQLSKSGISYVTQLETNRFGFLMDDQSLPELKKSLGQLEKQLSTIPCIRSFAIYIGKAQPLFQHFHLSIESADTMQEYFRLLSMNTSYFYEEFELLQTEKNTASEKELFKKLDTAIDLREKEAIKQQIHEIFAAVVAYPASSAYLGNIAYIIMLKLFQGFHKVYLNEFQAYAGKITEVTHLAAMVQLLVEVVDQVFSTAKISPYSAIIQRLLTIIDQEYNGPLTLKSASKTLYVNTAYLGQLFQKEVGISFNEYLNNYRMQTAKQKLTQTTDSVEAIALSVGFNEASYFSRKFKQYFNQSPNSYRAGK